MPVFGWFRDVKLVYKTLKEKVREYNRRDAKFYGNMFAKWRKLEHMDIKVSSGFSLLPSLSRFNPPLILTYTSVSVVTLQKVPGKQQPQPMAIDSAA